MQLHRQDLVRLNISSDLFHSSDRDYISRMNSTTCVRHHAKLNNQKVQAEMMNKIVNRTCNIEPHQRPSKRRSQIPASRQDSAERTQALNDNGGVDSRLELPVGCLDHPTALI